MGKPPPFGAMVTSSNSSTEHNREVERLKRVYQQQPLSSRLNSTSKKSFTTSPSSASGRLDPSKISDHRPQRLHNKSSLPTVPGSDDDRQSVHSDLSYPTKHVQRGKSNRDSV